MTPPYYKLADGRDFDAFAHAEITPYLGRLDKTETHFVLAALEYLFRQGRKPPGFGIRREQMDASDEQKQHHRWSTAREYFLKRMDRVEKEVSQDRHGREFDAIQRLAVSLVVRERELLKQLEVVR